MTSLDTNIVLRLFLNDLPKQTSLVIKFITDNSPVYLTDVVVTETVFVMENSMKIDRERICTLFKDLFATNDVIYNPYFLQKTLHLYQHSPALSIVDCYAAIESKIYGNKLVTFNKKLASQGGDHITLL